MSVESREVAGPSLSLYVHWPYCLSKCPYCDFNSHVSDAIDHARWRAAYGRALAHYADLMPGRTVRSIFFGGGTPSLMEPETVAHVIETARSLWPMAEDVEITLEANPTSVAFEKFSAFAAAGVNRVSIGVQSFDDAALKFLGREHNAAEARRALETASKYFDRYSFDLIYSRPDQDVKAWRQELENALQYEGGHLSLYQLTIEPGTPFERRHKRGEFEVPADEGAGSLYETTQTVLQEKGLPAYEISNHARVGQESRHNLAYWRYDDYVGIGPGAHGRLTLPTGEKVATRAHRAPDVWLSKVEKAGDGAYPFETLSHENRLVETVMMGMRLREGVPFSRLEREGGEIWRTFLDFEKITALKNEGYLLDTAEALIATDAGRQRLNALLAYLL